MAITRADLINILKQMRETANDKVALEAKDIYPYWHTFKDGYTFKVGDRVQHKEFGDEDSKLYKVITKHAKQDNWKPSQATASLWEVIDVTHSGDVNDPIPFSVNMIVYKDKYYTYNSATYLCIRNSEIALQNTPDQLIDNYFKLA